MTALRQVSASQLIRLERPDEFEEWRTHARALLASDTPPERVRWSEPGGETGDLFSLASAAGDEACAPTGLAVPRAWLALAQSALLHSDPQRFDLLYRLLWRLRMRPRLMEDAVDADVRRLDQLAREVRRDIHKMRAFVRFRAVEQEDGAESYVAWFEPRHHILRANAGFFVNRFASMVWTILTPRGSLHWDGAALSEGPPASRADAPTGDPVEELWRGYYASIFNPARLKIKAMLKEMPRRYWKNMPETALIPALVAGAQAREAAMVDAGQDMFADAERPDSLSEIRDAIQACRRCPIGCNGTRAVGGEGPENAALMIVGEQPGDVEESEGLPFVGPAGRLLMEHLEAAGIERDRAYVTNAVKHFKFSRRGKRRLHETPTAREIDMCRWWLESERGLVRPRLILALGASAARGVLGKTVSVQKERGRVHPLPDGARLWITTHPSYLLRLPQDVRSGEEARFAEDLRRVAEDVGS